jgi:hypothetical protein
MLPLALRGSSTCRESEGASARPSRRSCASAR